MRGLVKAVFALSCLLLIPSAAFAQGAIAGTVKDASGAVLPGVSVEAASPVLIEKTRTVVSDGSGNYRIEDLRPGTYTVTFTLSGFSTVKRDELLVSGSAVTTADATLRVGAVTRGQTYFAGIPTVTVSLAEAQRLALDGRPLATAIVTRGRPAAVPPGFAMLGNREVARDLERPVRQAKQTIGLIRLLLWVVAAGIIGAIVYLSVLERTRDFAALKAIGVSTGHLLGGLVLQAVVLSVLSALLAVGIVATSVAVLGGRGAY